MRIMVAATPKMIYELYVRVFIFVFILNMLIIFFYIGDTGQATDFAYLNTDKNGYAFGQSLKMGNSGFLGDPEEECLGFNEFINLSNDSLVSSPRLSASGENVFVV